MPINISILVIVPDKSLFDSEKWVREVESIMHQKTEPGLRRVFKSTTSGWKHQPDFVSHHYKTSSSIGVQVYTTNSVYGIVNAGYAKRRLTAKRGGIMRYQSGYGASTQPGSLTSRANFRGGSWRVAKSVFQGVNGRHFDEQIVEWYAPAFADDINKTFEAGLP